MQLQTQRFLVSASARAPKVNMTYGFRTDEPRAATPGIRIAPVFTLASALCLILVMFPARGSAGTVVSFSDSGASTGTISGNTVSGVVFNTILEIPGLPSGVLVNNFVEAYSNGVLTFSVSGAGNLATTGPFSNVSGTFITINEAAPTFPTPDPVTGAQSVNLYTAATSLAVSPAFLSDLGLTGVVSLDTTPFPTQISVTAQFGSVVSTDASLTFQVAPVPEASTISTLAIGLLGAGWLGIRREKIAVNCERAG